jgi:hypothetical protein
MISAASNLFLLYVDLYIGAYVILIYLTTDVSDNYYLNELYLFLVYGGVWGLGIQHP